MVVVPVHDADELAPRGRAYLRPELARELANLVVEVVAEYVEEVHLSC